jgi:hypothetical protein
MIISILHHVSLFNFHRTGVVVAVLGEGLQVLMNDVHRNRCGSWKGAQHMFLFHFCWRPPHVVPSLRDADPPLPLGQSASLQQALLNMCCMVSRSSCRQSAIMN